MSSPFTSAQEMVLIAGLAKGQFPLMTDNDRPQWECLVQRLEEDPEAFAEHVEPKPGREDRFAGKVAYVHNMEIECGFTRGKALVMAAHARLCKDHGVAIRPPWQGFIQRIRAVAEERDYVLASDIHLEAPNPDTDMGGGLAPSSVTIIPDASLGVTFGSVPDQIAMADQCPCWAAVVRRTYLAKLTKHGEKPVLGAKPHYVLAHLLNHNMNGPGDNPRNLIPLWAKANTEMERRVERRTKEAVAAGLTITFSVVLGPAMIEDPTYKAWSDAILKDDTLGPVERDILEWERGLPQFIECHATVKDKHGDVHQILGGVIHIPNFVPMEVPIIWK